MIVLAIIGVTSFFLPNLLAFKGPMGGGKWWYSPAVKDKLQLTPDQTNKINKIWMEHRKRIIDIKSDIEKGYLDLENLMGQSMVEREKAYKLAESLGQLHAKQIEERIRMTIDIRKELSVEQFQKLKSLRGELAKRLREKGHRGEKRGRSEIN